MLTTAALALMLGQRLQTPITLQVNNDTLPNVIAKVSERIGIPIRVTGGPLRDWVYVDFNQRTAKSVLDSLAVICKAEWEEIDGEIIFRSPWPPKDMAQPERQRQISVWMSRNPAPAPLTEESGKKLVFDIRSLSQQPEGLTGANALMRQTPIPRAHLRLLHAIGAERLSRIPEGEGRTFLLKPENRAEAFPAAAAQILGDLAAERSFYRDVITSLGMNGDELGGFDWRPAYVYYLEPEPDERLWCVTIRNTGRFLQSTLRGFGGRDRFYEKVTDEATIRFDEATPKHPITDAQVRTEFRAMEVWHQEPGQRLAEMSRMDEQEMLTSRVHELYRLWADETKTDVAAVIPDGAYIWATYGRTSNNLAIVINQSFLEPVEYRVQDGISLFTSPDLDRMRRSRISRDTAAAYARQVAETGDASLETAANLAVACEWTEAYQNAVSLVRSDLRSDLSFSHDAPLLRLYGRLTPAQQELVRADGLQLTYGILSRSQKDDVEELLQIPGAGLNPRIALPDLDADTRYEGDFFALTGPNLPVQISASTPVLIRFHDLQKFYAVRYADGEPFLGEVTAKDVAYFKVYAPDSWDRVDRYVVSDQSFLQAALDFGPAGRFARTARPSEPTAAPVPMEQMPPAFQEEFRRHLEIYRRAKGGG